MKYHLMDSMGNTTLVADPGAQLELFDDENRRPLAAHIWRREADGFYVDPAWVAERLFAAEKFIGSVWDPGCGVGRVSDAARRRGYETHATDIVDRGYQHFDQTLNFLLCERPLGNNIIANPPFQICDQFLRHALKLDVDAVAMIWLARRLNAAHWLADTPLARVYLLTPRPSMPPGEVIARGEKPRGGKQDFVWLVFRRGHVGPPELRWLHRDPGDERKSGAPIAGKAIAASASWERHREIGVHASALSGAFRFRGSGHDVDCYVFGTDEAPLVCEVKAR